MDSAPSLKRAVPDVLYRTESYSGSLVRNLRDIIEYEMSELRNTDIPRYVLGHYDLPEKLRKEIEDTLSLEETGEYPFLRDRYSLRELVKSMIGAVSRQTGMKLRYGLWLAGKDAVKRLYLNDGDVTAYRTSAAVFSDLGDDGILFAYPELPLPQRFNNRQKKYNEEIPRNRHHL